ncbi:hypothetical protein J2W34_001189 [Variovorax boronicumulans]|nr:hypothetical protein [Variovorax boronicumulans]
MASDEPTGANDCDLHNTSIAGTAVANLPPHSLM